MCKIERGAPEISLLNNETLENVERKK